MTNTGEKKELSYKTMKNIRWMKKKLEKDQEVQKAKNRAVNNCTPAINRLKASKKWAAMSKEKQIQAEKEVRDKYAAKLEEDITAINKKFIALDKEVLTLGKARQDNSDAGPIAYPITKGGPSTTPAILSEDINNLGEEINLNEFPGCKPFLLPGMTERQIRKAYFAAQKSRKLMARIIWNDMRKEKKMPPDSIKKALLEEDIEISDSEEEKNDMVPDIDEEEGDEVDEDEDDDESDDESDDVESDDDEDDGEDGYEPLAIGDEHKEKDK